jgi:hypothetical protein
VPFGFSDPAAVLSVPGEGLGIDALWLPAASAGDQSTPGMWSRVKRCSETPFEVVSEVKR